MTRLILSLLFITTITITAYAEWTGPVEVVSFNYGNKPDAIGIYHSDYDSEVKSIIDVDHSGNILVGDQINKKVFLVNSTGFVENVISPRLNQDEKYIWPRSLFALDSNSFLVSSGSLHQIYSYRGELLHSFNIGKTHIKYVFEDYSLSIYSKSDKSYKRYTKHGDFIGELNDTWFFESFIYGERINEKYSYEINYPENETKLLLPYKSIVKFSKSKNNTYNVHASKKNAEVVKIDSCGRLLGSFKVPEDVYSNGIPTTYEGREDIPLLLNGYGNPIFGKDGNVYTWKQTPDTYSILKWEWVDSPSDPKSDCPK